MTITPLPQVAGFDAPIGGGLWASTGSACLPGEAWHCCNESSVDGVCQVLGAIPSVALSSSRTDESTSAMRGLGRTRTQCNGTRTRTRNDR